MEGALSGYSSRRTSVRHLFLVIAATFVAYHNSLSGAFVWDDNLLIVDNPFIKDWAYLASHFTTDFFIGSRDLSQIGYYRPLVTLTYMADYSIWGLDPYGFHLTNVILHVINGVLVYLVSSLIFEGRRAPLITALLFAAHPVHTESVAWVSGRTDLIVAVFFFSALYFYMRSHDEGRLRISYSLTIAFFVLALLSKEVALMLPPVLVLYDLCFHREKVRDRLKYHAPLFIIGALYLAIRFRVLEIMPASTTDAPTYLVALTFLKALSIYTWKLVFPVELNAYYMMDLVESLADPFVILSVCLSFFAVFYLLKTKKRNMSFAVCFFLITILPVSNIIPISVIEELSFGMAERFLYLPSFGFCLVAGEVISVVPSLKTIPDRALNTLTFLVVTLLLLFYVVKTIDRNSDWRDTVTIYTETIASSPGSYILHNNLGFAYYQSGELEKALAEYRKAFSINPRQPTIRNNFGIIYAMKGDFEKALVEYRVAVETAPLDPLFRNNLGNLYNRMSMIDEAIREYREALFLNPSFAEAHNNLAFAYEKKGLFKEALVEYRKAVRINPDYTAARRNTRRVERLLVSP